MSDLATLLSRLSRTTDATGGVSAVGTVMSWSATHTEVMALGVVLRDLPYLAGVTATAGQQVLLLRCAGTLVIAGRLVTIP